MDRARTDNNEVILAVIYMVGAKYFFFSYGEDWLCVGMWEDSLSMESQSAVLHLFRVFLCSTKC